MKKNKMMRVAAVMLVCVLLSTSIISGTFAKYVTERSANDHARVAKFGVVIDADGWLFTNHDPITAEGTAITVAASGGVNDTLVAPGTRHTEADGECFKFSVSGTPEVKVHITFELLKETVGEEQVDMVSDIYMPASNNYLNYVTGDVADDKFTVPSGGYYPVRYTVWNKKSGDVEYTAVYADKTLAEVAAWLTDDENRNFEFGPNQDLAAVFGEYMLTWEWPFEDAERDWVDAADTFLGNHAADPTTYPLPTGLTGYSENAKLGLKVTVTQVD